MSSATGGYLTPTATSISGRDLRRALHGYFVGVLGLDNTDVIQAWQATPPKTKSIDHNWLAFRVENQQHDANSNLIQNETGSVMERVIDFDVFCVFYGVDAEENAAILRDSFELSQNCELLEQFGVKFIQCDQIIHAPESFNDQFINRADLRITLNQQVSRDYEVLSLLSAEGVIQANVKGSDTLDNNFNSENGV